MGATSPGALGAGFYTGSNDKTFIGRYASRANSSAAVYRITRLALPVLCTTSSPLRRGHRPDVLPGYDHVVEPDSLLLAPIRAGRVAFVIAVVL